MLGRCPLPQKDFYPQWRVVAWSVEGDLVACSASDGKVHVYDVMGAHVASIPRVSVLIFLKAVRGGNRQVQVKQSFNLVYH